MLVKSLRFVFCTIPLMSVVIVRMLLYALFLLPAFMRMDWFYAVASDRKEERYKEDSIRNAIDIYGSNGSSNKPVLVYFPGGAWMVGNKKYAALLARAMVRFGVLVMVADYRNYPLGNVPDMAQDVEDAMIWVKHNCSRFGGDPKRIVAVGQSAGGHLLTCLLLRKAMAEMPKDHDDSFQPKRDLCGVVALSTPFDMSVIGPFFVKLGLDDGFVDRLFGGRLVDFDPFRLASMLATRSSRVAERMPPIHIFHGTHDYAVPYQGAVDFGTTLRRDLNVQDVAVTPYEGMTHTDPILEGVMEGNHRFHRDLVDAMKRWAHHDVDFDDAIPECQRLCPAFLISMARCIKAF